MGILAHALAHSRLVRESTHLFKISGRYFVANAHSLLACVRDAHPPPDIVCDLRENLTVADSRWFAGSVAFFRDHLVTRRAMIDDSRNVFFEHALARAVHSAMGAGLAWRFPATAPRLIGITGTTDKAIRIGPSKRLMHHVKHRVFRY